MHACMHGTGTGTCSILSNKKVPLLNMHVCTDYVKHKKGPIQDDLNSQAQFFSSLFVGGPEKS